LENLKGRGHMGGPGVKVHDNIKMDHAEMRYKDVDWSNPAQDREQRVALVNTVMNLRVSQKAENFLASLASLRSSKRTAPWS
jgi:hypothetical protein